MTSGDDPQPLYEVAVVGMAGRFPGAASVEELWEVLKRGAETVSFFTPEELEASGIPREVSSDPRYVPARGVLAGADLFDAAFFGLTPREARILDPQQRIFFECAWETLESAACDPGRFAGAIGIYAGMSQSSYLRNLLSNPGVPRWASGLEIKLGTDKDFLTTQASYRLNLRGPSINVATACSTSLVAVHLACQGLLNRECDLALAGGACVGVPQKAGYFYQEGGIYSADGHCRAFDAVASGSIGGDGVGVVLLKRLEDALRDRDPIRAVIKGSALNNDGALKIGFTAPSVEGQAAVIAEAQTMAGVDPGTITYVEAHGSATPLGDPVEIRALTRAFRAGTDRTGFCAVGSVKTNLGHLDAAAGVTGLIKTVLALEHRLIPPSLNFTRPNPEIPFGETPFYVADRLADWRPPAGTPRRAGVNSFGIGGTNAHVVLEEAPAREASGPSRPSALLVLSAATPAALESATDRLAVHLKNHPGESLADVAFTGQIGRKPLRHRRALVCRDRQDAVAVLSGRDPRRLLTSDGSVDGRPVAFLFPGLGDHYPGMARGLYETEPLFRREIDRASELLLPILGADVRDLLFAADAPPAGSAGPDLRRMLGTPGSSSPTRTDLLHPAVFVLEIALARLWRSWGVRPTGMLGYSLGEYAAACLAGVFSLEDGLRIVAERARSIERLPPGAMLAVPLPESSLEPLLGEELALAAVNAPDLQVVSGPPEAVAALQRELAGRGIVCRALPVSRAFHSPGMAPAGRELARLLAGIELRPPEVPFVSNVTGSWITAAEATDPGYWARHLLSPVRFAQGLQTLWQGPALALLEVGPGHGLTTLALQQAGGDPERVALPSLRPVYDGQADDTFLLGTLARLWLSGVEVSWTGFHAGERRNRLVLPTYPFQRQSYWVEPGARLPLPATAAQETVDAEPPAAIPADPRPGLGNAYAAPRDATEERIAGIWRQILALERVGIHDSFFALGGHSLLAPRVLLALHEAFGVDVPLARLLAQPTVAELAGAVAGLLRGEGSEPTAAAPADLETEVVLEAAIRPEAAAPAAPAAVLLTGATGFLGAFLLRDLLRETPLTVCCLVRAASPEEGRRKIAANLAAYRIAVGEDAERRIVPVPGDLAAPRWGLAEAAFRALAERVEAVYHCGAWVNFTYPYESLKPTNVLGTVEALRLASLGRPKPVHFVSTIAVFAPGSLTAEGVALEDSPLPDSQGLAGGYPQSKWVAEKLVGLARERGIVASIYRPGVIAGEPRTGIGNPRDLIWSFLKGCLQMAAAPDLAGRFDPVPVDYVSRGIVHLSRRRDALGGSYHFANPESVSWREVFGFAKTLGYPLRLLPPAAWMQELREAVRNDPGQALAPFWPLLQRHAGEASGEPETPPAEAEILPEARLRFDLRNTLHGLAGSGIVCPPVDRRLLAVYFDFLIGSGYLPAPAAGRSEEMEEEILR